MPCIPYDIISRAFSFGAHAGVSKRIYSCLPVSSASVKTLAHPLDSYPQLLAAHVEYP
jgi:hypothetical protein